LAKHKETVIFAAILIVYLDLHLAFNEVDTALVAFISPVAVHKRKKSFDVSIAYWYWKCKGQQFRNIRKRPCTGSVKYLTPLIADRKSPLVFIVDEY
jgi:hypothetical protein